MTRETIPKAVQARIFQRDKWCCRYCGIEVFLSPALEAMERLAPDHGYWQRNGRSDKMTKLLLARCAWVDHPFIPRFQVSRQVRDGDVFR